MKKILLIIGLLAGTGALFAQKSYDFGLFLGISDKHLHSILPFPVSEPVIPAGGLYFRYNLNPRYSLRGGVNGGLSGSPVLDAYGLFEFNFHVLNPKRSDANISSYVSSGISYLTDFNMRQDAINLVNSNPLYSMAMYYGRNLTIPFHVGVRYLVTPRLTVGAEWALRKTFQINWIDPENRMISNWRSFIGITIGYRMKKPCPTCPFYETARKKRR